MIEEIKKILRKKTFNNKEKADFLKIQIDKLEIDIESLIDIRENIEPPLIESMEVQETTIFDILQDKYIKNEKIQNHLKNSH